MKIPNSNNSTTSLEHFDRLIKLGDIMEARKLVRMLNRNSISRAELVRYAGIANRVYEPRIAHRFLQSIIREAKGQTPPSEIEKIEYAEALRGMGLIQESIALLKEVDSNAHPVVYLRLSFCEMTQWHYSEAIRNLEKYISVIPSSEYSATIARVNLAAALIIERQYEKAQELLQNLRAETKAASLHLLYGNCLELTAQMHILQGQFDLADQIFTEASSAFGENLARYAIYLRKWKAISKSLQKKMVDPELLECRKIAEHDSDWETMRDCDLYIGYLTRNQNLIHQVYFGTPYEPYRRRIRDLVGPESPIPEQWIWRPDVNAETSAVFDLLKGGFDNSSSDLEPGQLMHRMFILLSRDFYRPLTVGSAFSELFPEEHFFQLGSTNRVSHVIMRLRTWLAENGEHFTIEENDGSYRLKPTGNTGIRIHFEKPELSVQALTWEKLRRQLSGQREFTRSDVVRVLDCSPSSASRLISWSVESNQCETIGAGRQRKYRFAA